MVQEDMKNPIPHSAIIMIDEVHLISLDVEFLLGVLPMVLKRRPDLRLVLTSATCDSKRLLAHFSSFSPIKIEVPGRPQQLTHVHLGSADMTSSYEVLIVRCIRLMFSDPRIMDGDALVFPPNADDIPPVIRKCKEALNQDHGDALKKVEFIELSYDEPLDEDHMASTDRVDETGVVKRKIIFATNVAGSSITLPRVRLIVLSGKRTFDKYDCTTRSNETVTESCSQAELTQMAGRAGRTQSGLVMYCFKREVYDKLALRTPDTLHHGDLTKIVMRIIGTVGNMEDFKWYTGPSQEQIQTSLARLVANGMIRRG
jgi:ATP-dependent helicase HrpA